MSCEGCARWIGEPADDNCIKELDGVATCQSKAATIAAVPGWGADTCPTGWTGCSSDVVDVAETSGACKTYENVVVLQSDERAKDCDVVVRASVDGFGSLTFADNSLVTSSSYANGTSSYKLRGAADAVAQALAAFEFCPGCVDETYALTFALDDVSCGICTVAGVSHDLKIKATTQLAHVFHGRVVKAAAGLLLGGGRERRCGLGRRAGAPTPTPSLQKRTAPTPSECPTTSASTEHGLLRSPRPATRRTRRASCSARRRWPRPRLLLGLVVQ